MMNIDFRRMSRREILALFGAGLAAACSSATSSSSSTSSVPVGKQGSDTITLAASEMPTSLDPAGATGVSAYFIASNYVSSLLRYKILPSDAKFLPSAADVEAEIAESWTVAPDGITFKLRQTKSPAGNPVSGEDVKWSIERNVALKASIPGIVMGLAGIDTQNPVTVVDASTVKVNCKTNPLSLGILALFFLPVLDSVEAKKHATSDDPWAAKWLDNHTASYAPYEVESFVSGQEVRLKVNQAYFRGAPAISRLNLRAIPESSSRLQVLNTGSIDWARQLTNTDFNSLKGKSGIQSVVLPSVGSHFLAVFMNKNPILQDVKVRQALSLAIDRNALVQGPYAGLAVPARTMTSSYLRQPEPLPAAFPYDPAKAKQLLSEAGATDLNLIMGTFPTALFSAGTDTQSIAVLIQSMLRAVGVQTSLITEPSSSQVSAGIAAKKYDLTLRGFIGLVPDAGYNLSLIFPSKANLNYGYNNPQIDSLFEKLTPAPVGPERDKLVGQISEILRNDMPIIPLVDEVRFEAMKTGITGVAPSPSDQVNFYEVRRA